MDFVIPLDEMTSEDKLAAMERLWEDLCRNPESVPSPTWHEDVLLAREKQVQEGRAKFFKLLPKETKSASEKGADRFSSSSVSWGKDPPPGWRGPRFG
ncbi:MAG: addiction module protein [Desulfobacterales bacterium]|nr:addiction module protein [Desulfobacterales bacterium]